MNALSSRNLTLYCILAFCACFTFVIWYKDVSIVQITGDELLSSESIAKEHVQQQIQSTQAPAKRVKHTKAVAKNKPLNVLREDYSWARDIKVPGWLQSYIEFHTKMNGDPNAKYLIYTCPGSGCGGIGDRVKGLVSMFYLAMLSNRVFLINWRNTRPLTESLVPNLIDWDTGAANLLRTADVNLVEIDRKAFQIPLFKNFTMLMGSTKTIAMLTNVHMLKDMWRHRGLRERCGGHESEEFDPRLTRYALETLFAPSRELSNTLDRVSKQMGLSRQEPYIGVHIRLGSGSNRFGDPPRHRLDQVPVFVNCAHNMSAVLGVGDPKSLPIYVAADVQSAKNEFSKYVPAVHWMEQSAYHIDRSSREGAKEGTLEAWAEIFLLKDSACLVRSYSGFSFLPLAWSRNLGDVSGRCSAYFTDCTMEVLQNSIVGAGVPAW